MTRTYSPKEGEIDRRWFIVDADGHTVGRLSTVIARVLSGKTKPTFAPHLDTGDFVVVVNAEKVQFTGRKEDQKIYYRHSGRPGSLQERTAAELRVKHPTDILKKSIKGMLPKGPLGRKQLSKLKLYAGGEHPHAAQQPEVVDFGAMNVKNKRNA